MIGPGYLQARRLAYEAGQAQQQRAAPGIAMAAFQGPMVQSDPATEAAQDARKLDMFQAEQDIRSDARTGSGRGSGAGRGGLSFEQRMALQNDTQEAGAEQGDLNRGSREFIADQANATRLKTAADTIVAHSADLDKRIAETHARGESTDALEREKMVMTEAMKRLDREAAQTRTQTTADAANLRGTRNNTTAVNINANTQAQNNVRNSANLRDRATARLQQADQFQRKIERIDKMALNPGLDRAARAELQRARIEAQGELRRLDREANAEQRKLDREGRVGLEALRSKDRIAENDAKEKARAARPASAKSGSSIKFIISQAEKAARWEIFNATEEEPDQSKHDAIRRAITAKYEKEIRDKIAAEGQ